MDLSLLHNLPSSPWLIALSSQIHTGNTMLTHLVPEQTFSGILSVSDAFRTPWARGFSL